MAEDVAEKTDLVATLTAEQVTAAFLDEKRADALILQLTEATKLAETAETPKGRAVIKSTAAQLARVKTTFDKARLSLTADYRDKIKKINDHGGSVIERLQTLQDTVRLPLTEWEQNEKLRVEVVDKFFGRCADIVVIRLDDTAEVIQKRIDGLSGYDINPAVFGDRAEEAAETKKRTLSILNDIWAGASLREAQAAELATLRAAEDERQRQEAIALAAQKAAEEAAQRQRDEDARIAAAAELARQEEAQRLARAHEEELARVQREADAAAAATAAAHEAEMSRIERQRIADEQTRIDAEAERAEAERMKQEAEDRRRMDEAHRAQIIGEAAMALHVLLSRQDIDAEDIIDAIIDGQIPHVTVNF